MLYTHIVNLLFSISSIAAATTVGVVEPVNYYQYAQFQTSFSWESIINRGLEHALESCQRGFKWQRWNCPSGDFLLRRASSKPSLDREDIYVAAIAMAGIVHTLTKDCANGLIVGCGCSANAYNAPCAHEPAKAVQLYEQRFGEAGSEQPVNSAAMHNLRVVGKLLHQSLEQECHCKQLGTQGQCLQEQCVSVLKPFEVVAQNLLQMYDDAIQLDSTDSNLKTMWQNIPLDTLVYMQDSPNYCESDTERRWSGTRGRQCSKSGGPADERLSCTQLCRVCGYRVRSQYVRSERHCNCQFVWGLGMQCDVCVQLEKQYHCY